MLTCSWATAAAPLGWRGDGTGIYPDASPPISWGRSIAGVSGLHYSADKPADGVTGAAMPDGVVREWLILGPVVAKQPDQDVLPDESILNPESGQEAGGQKWRKVTLDSAYLNFTTLCGKPTDVGVAAFAFTHVYSATGGLFRLGFTRPGGNLRVYLNGKKLGGGNRMTLDLAKGWNHLLLRLFPGENDWYAVPVFQGRGPCQYEEHAIAWRTPLPGIHFAFYGGGMGVGSPVVVGDKLYLQSEPHDLICLDKKTGKLLWIERAGYFESATDDDKKQPAYQEAQTTATKIDALNAIFIKGAATQGQMEDKNRLEAELRKQMKAVDGKKYPSTPVPDVGFSGFTPCTNGQFIYAWFADGVSACFDLNGKRQWIRVNQRAPVEHGFSSSPLLIDGKFIVFMRDLLAFDAQTGTPVWQTPIVSATGFNTANFIHGSLVAAAVGKTPLVVLGNGVIVRASDGKIVYQETKGDTQAVPSPVVAANNLFFVIGNQNLTIRTLPATVGDSIDPQSRKIPIDISDFPKHYLPWHLSSPLVHEGLVYLVNNAGVLSVIDAEAGKVIYQKLLDLNVFQDHNEGAARGIGISPILAGNHIYLIGNSGASLVIEPGREYRQIAKNNIENIALPGHWSERQERFVANPVADGNRLYLRGEEAIYAIGEK